MKITFLSAFDKMGGAAIAARRLFYALKKRSINVAFLVQFKTGGDDQVKTPLYAKADRFIHYSFLAVEIFIFSFFRKSKREQYKFSTGLLGRNIASTKLVRESDIIHLHWINQGFLSLKGIEKLFRLNKPIVWTLHDMWAFTGGCHYSEQCLNFEEACGNCFLLKKPNPNDLSHRIWNKKSRFFNPAQNITVVACSDWLQSQAKKSSLFRDFNVVSIPNPIDVEKYRPLDKEAVRKELNLEAGKKYILAGAANITNYYKGFSFLLASMRALKRDHPGSKEEVEVLLFGKTDPVTLEKIPYAYRYFSYLSAEDDIINLYNASSVFSLPSLQDNLPNMVVESLSCGVPVVAFNTGGIPQLVDHLQTGYLAEYRSAEDFAKGLYYVLYESDYQALSKNARQKAVTNYSEEAVTSKYMDVYQKALENHGT